MSFPITPLGWGFPCPVISSIIVGIFLRLDLSSGPFCWLQRDFSRFPWSQEPFSYVLSLKFTGIPVLADWVCYFSLLRPLDPEEHNFLGSRFFSCINFWSPYLTPGRGLQVPVALYPPRGDALSLAPSFLEAFLVFSTRKSC